MPTACWQPQTDTAICIPQEQERKITPLAFPIAFTPSGPPNLGVTGIDSRLQNFLRNNVQILPGLNDREAKHFREQLCDFVYGEEWKVFRHAFQGDADLIITLKSCPSNGVIMAGPNFSIQGNVVTVSRYVISWFPTWNKRGTDGE